jgi:hypothetical protein
MFTYFDKPSGGSRNLEKKKGGGASRKGDSLSEIANKRDIGLWG